MSGLVIRKNMFPSPMFSHYLTSYESETDVEVSNGAITVSGADENDSYVYLDVSGLDPRARVVFRCGVEPLGQWTYGAFGIWFYGTDWSTISGICESDIHDGYCQVEFSVPDDGVVGIRFRAMNGGTRYCHPLLENADTFDQNLPFFYYGTMPDPRSA